MSHWYAIVIIVMVVILLVLIPVATHVIRKRYVNNLILLQHARRKQSLILGQN